MTEQQIQAKILKKLSMLQVYAIKIVVANHRGCPDILACHEGKFYGLEVKRPGQAATEVQEWHIQKIKEAGGEAGVVTCVSEALSLLGIK